MREPNDVPTALPREQLHHALLTGQSTATGAAASFAPAPAADGDWSEEVLKATVLPSVLGKAVPQEHPVVVFVLGQGGSGKTLVVDLVHAALQRRGGAVRVDRDAYKAVHPRYAAFLAEDVRTAGVRVRPETYRWQAEVETRVCAGRYDAVVEEPLAHPQDFLARAAAHRQAGHRVEIVALAVHEALGQLGRLERYLRLAEEGRPRYVSWDNAASCADALVDTLRLVETAHLADRIFVVRRSAEMALEVLYENELAPAGHLCRPAGAAVAVLAEWARPWDARETGRFRRALAAADRRANAADLPEDWALAVRRDAERAAALAEPVRRIAQPRRQAPGVDYHRLNPEEHRWIYEELVLPSLGPVTPQQRPVVVYVIGQPGAGKTRIARLIGRTLRSPVHISGDDFKVAHPDYLRLLREEPRTASARIRADYRAWQAWAEAHVRRQRGDMVIELTPASAAELIARTAADRRAGYWVELAVLAVRAADSRQGTADRYARAHQQGVPARFTTAAGHDTHFAVLPDVVAAAEQLAAVDSVVVMRRDGHARYRNQPTSSGRLARPVVDGVLVAEQFRPYTAEEAERFWAIQRRLHTVMPQYRDDLTAIGALACPLMPTASRLRQLDVPATAAALPVPA